MNIRKEIDYSAMQTALDLAVAQNLPQMEMYCEIGKAICARPEKGAAVAAASYLSERYPNMAGVSPRNVRRMRDFYRLYGDMPELLAKTLRLNWTQNVVIMEAELTAEARAWYIDEAFRCNPTKAELLELLASEAHLQIPLDQTEECWYKKTDYKNSEFNLHEEDTFCAPRQDFTVTPEMTIFRGLRAGNSPIYYQFTTRSLDTIQNPTPRRASERRIIPAG